MGVKRPSIILTNFYRILIVSLSPNSMHQFISRYFGFNEKVDRRFYLTTGLCLMIFKYVVDAIVIWLGAHEFWTPLDYLAPFYILRVGKLANFPAWLAIYFVFWTLPFIWLGVSMTLRRAIDAGRSPWWCLLFFVPLFNYALMLRLATLPTSAHVQPQDTPVPLVLSGRFKSAAAGVLAGIAIAVISVLLSAFALQVYGLALFLATPFLIGAIAAYVHNHGHPRTFFETQNVVLLTLILTGGTLLAFALEGLVCLMMALGPALVAALLGGVAGRIVALTTSPSTAACCLLLLPLVSIIDRTKPAPDVVEVVSAIEVNAPAEHVWEQVIQFKQIETTPDLIFRLGIAYPVRAQIKGNGVGAVRYCEFSTGAFVEPITDWQAPTRLSFDVVAQPPSLQEWSPYRTVYAPHVNGFFQAHRGEFRLIPMPNNRTRLEGSTWYTLSIYPSMYWGPISNWLITKIHTRVLEQVKHEAEESLL